MESCRVNGLGRWHFLISFCSVANQRHTHTSHYSRDPTALFRMALMNWFACFGLHIGTYCIRRLVVSLWSWNFFVGMKNHAEEVSTQFCVFNTLGIVCSREGRVMWILGLACEHGVCHYQYALLLRGSLKFPGVELTVSISRIASGIPLL